MMKKCPGSLFALLFIFLFFIACSDDNNGSDSDSDFGVIFMVFECNEDYSTQVSKSAYASDKAKVTIYYWGEDSYKVKDVIYTHSDGKASYKHDGKQRLYYKVEKGDKGQLNRGYLVKGIFTSQAEIDTYPQYVPSYGAQIHGVKYADINGDKQIDERDKVLSDIFPIEYKAGEHSFFDEAYIISPEYVVEYSFEITNDFVYINTSDFYKYGINQSQVMMTHDVMEPLSKGDCIIASYKIYPWNVTNNIFEAEEMTINQVFYNNDQVKIQALPVPEVIDNQVFPARVRLGSITPADYMGDRWMFDLTYEDEGDSGFVPMFYYDINKQFEKEGQPLSDNQVILDMRFVKKTPNIGSKENKTELFVANLSGLKIYYTRINYNVLDAMEYEPGKKVVPVYLKFRYYTDQSEDPLYLSSSWNLDYCIYFYEGK